jgi:hypothetical protein
MWGLGHLLAFPLERRPCDDLREVHIEQSSLLAFELCQNVTQRLPSGLQGLEPPFPQLRPFQCMGDEGRLPPHAAEVLPDQFV